MGKKSSLIFGLFVLGALLLSGALYWEAQRHHETEMALRQLVMDDISEVEQLMRTQSLQMKEWSQYLNLPVLRESLKNDSEASIQVQNTFLVILKFAHGAEKYPPLMTLRQSLDALRTWKRLSFARTLFMLPTNQEKYVQLRQQEKAKRSSNAAALASNVSAEDLAKAEEEFMKNSTAGIPSPPQSSLFNPEVAELMDAAEENAETEISAASSNTSRSLLHRFSSNAKNAEKTPAQKGSPIASEPKRASRKNDVKAKTASKTKLEHDAVSKEKMEAELETALNLDSWDSETSTTEELPEENFDEQFDENSDEQQIKDFPEMQPLELPESAANAKQTEQLRQLDERLTAHSLMEKLENVSSIEKEFAAGEKLFQTSFHQNETQVALLCQKNEPQSAKPANATAGNDSAQFVEVIPELALENAQEDSNTNDSQESADSPDSDTSKPAEENAENAVSQEAPQTNEHQTANALDGHCTLKLPEVHFTLQELLDQTSIEDLKNEEGLTLEKAVSELKGNLAADAAFLAKVWLVQEYVHPSEEKLTAAYEEIRSAGSHINLVLNKAAPEKRQKWIKCLNWELFSLDSPMDVCTLQELQAKLCSGIYGLELQCFSRMRKAIDTYLTIDAQMQDQAAGEAIFQLAKVRMVKLLILAQNGENSLIHRAIDDLSCWFENAGQAAELLQITRNLWSNPNFVLHLNQSLFERFGNFPVNEVKKISEQSGMATIYGTNNFTGTMALKPVVNEEKIEIQLALTGSSESKTRAYAGPAIVSTRADSAVTVEKSIYFGEEGFAASKTDVQIKTKSQIQGVRDVRDRMLIENFAARRAYAQKPEMERSAVARNKAQLRNRFDRAIADTIKDWNEVFLGIKENQLQPRNVTPLQTRIWSDDLGAYVQTCLSNEHRLGASALPKEVSEKCDLYAAIHETSLQNLFAGMFGGIDMNEFTRKQIANSAPEWLKKSLESKLSENQGASDWSIQLAQNWPFKVSFDGGKISFEIQCAKLVNEGKDYPALNITAVYSIVSRDGSLVLVRDGNVEILPVDFNPAVQRRLPAGIIGLRRVMGKRLQKLFKDEFVLSEVQLFQNQEEKDLPIANLTVRPVFVQAEDGWLQIGLNLDQKKEEEEEKEAVPAAQETAKN